MSYGKSFLAAILAEGSVSALVEYGKIDQLFKASEIDAYAFVREFVLKFGALPTAETIETHTGQMLSPATEPASYYRDQMGKRHIDLTLRQAMKEAHARLTSEVPDPDAALEIIMNGAMTLIASKNGKQVSDFRHAKAAILVDYASKWKEKNEYGLQLGWPYLDDLSGGLRRGDLISYVGRPGQGKTWSLLFGALHGWAKAADQDDAGNQQSRMFVSMEMDVLPVQQRLAAMHCQVPMSHLKQATLATPNLVKMKKGLSMIEGYAAPFYIVDGNLTATVEDIHMMALQLKPAAIFIDGGYLVKHPFERDRFRRVAENADLMKKNLASLAPTVVSWQFAKSASKKAKSKGDPVDLDDIGYTDAIAQLSSLVIGIFEDDSVASVKGRRIEILKGRAGETGSFRTKWDFEKMDFGQVEDEDVGNLQLV